ncbi:PREDICTED: transmembrane protein 242 [Nicrophorus vespilloides]|uniref:Transmembrane protein 242 n=1 Tax=Nicrophorus vespilloides TaxID=110193 RepID=A0ABM1M5K1_NICVS|nr:PREDICTED: transmembrane protein 242 [Nicrophorus vespilloides]
MGEKLAEVNNVLVVNDVQKNDNFRTKAGIFLAGVAGMSVIFGFGATVASAKKSDPRYFDKGLTRSIELGESGANLAARALGWGTLYAFTGCGVLFYTIWKFSGASNMQEFRQKMGSLLPVVPKNNPPQSRTEFSGMNDLLEYLQTMKSKKDS